MADEVILYPVGYGTELVTEEEMRRRYEPHLHPNVAGVLWPFLRSRRGKLGIGGGRRLVQPDKPGFAPDGKSFHQDQQFKSGFKGYAALDLVARNESGGPHRAPRWDEVPRQGSKEAEACGLHMNVDDEPWHAQHIDMDGYTRWVLAGRPDPRKLDPAPAPAPAPAKPAEPTVAEMKAYADHMRAQVPPVAPKPTLRKGMPRDREVYFLQVGLVEWHKARPEIPSPGNPDGLFGPRTAAAVAAWQRSVLKVADDGIYGPKTAEAAQLLANNLYALELARKGLDHTLAEYEARAAERIKANVMPKPTLRRDMDRNAEVYLLQSVLQRYHANDPKRMPTPGRADGLFGPMTEQAVRALQREYLQVAVDGVYGPKTAGKFQELADALRRMFG